MNLTNFPFQGITPKSDNYKEEMTLRGIYDLPAMQCLLVLFRIWVILITLIILSIDGVTLPLLILSWALLWQSALVWLEYTTKQVRGATTSWRFDWKNLFSKESPWTSPKMMVALLWKSFPYVTLINFTLRILCKLNR